MANSMRVTELSSYKQGKSQELTIDTNDVFLISSGESGEIKSYKISYEQLYNALYNKLNEDLSAAWKNPELVQSFNELDPDDEKKALGSKLGAEILDKLTYLQNNLSMALWS